MKLVVQRVTKADVKVNNKVVGEIGNGFVVLVGIGTHDTHDEVDYLVQKLIKLRVFTDENEKMNLSIKDVEGELLIISQFTLYADCNKGNRPSFVNAAKPDMANELYEYFITKCKEQEIKVETGIFGADMQINLVNDGPVTIIMEKDAYSKMEP